MTAVKPPPLPLIFSITVTGILANTLVGPAIPDHREVIGSVTMGFVIFMLIFGLFLTAMPVVLESELGLSAGQRGLVIAVPGITSTFTALRLGWLRATFGGVRLLVAAGALL